MFVIGLTSAGISVKASLLLLFVRYFEVLSVCWFVIGLSLHQG